MPPVRCKGPRATPHAGPSLTDHGQDSKGSKLQSFHVRAKCVQVQSSPGLLLCWGPLSWGFGVSGPHAPRADRQSGSQASPVTSGDWRLGSPVVGIRGTCRVFTRLTQDVGAPRKGPGSPLALCPVGGLESPGQRLPGGTWLWEAEKFPAGVFQAWPEAPQRGSRGARDQHTRGRSLS